MENQAREFYQKRVENITDALKQSKRSLRLLVIIRLITFLLIFPSVFFLLPKMLIPGVLLAVFFLITFLFLIKVHLKRDLKHKHLNELLKINLLELEALDYKYNSFDPGEEFIDTSHSFSYDMDLFGEGSVFQFLNRTVTFMGKSFLAGFMTRESLDPNQISERQTAIKELSSMPEILQDFMGLGKINSEGSHDNAILNDWISQPNFYLNRKFFLYLAYLLPAATISAIILAILVPSLSGLPIGLYLLQLFIISQRLRHTGQNHQTISKRLEILKKYYSLLTIIEKGKYEGKELTALSALLFTEELSASRSIHALTKIVSAFDARLNILVAIFLEGILLWDIQCMIRLERWKTNQGSKLQEWINAIAKYDALASIATFAFNHPDFSYPEFSNKHILKAKDLGHILIPPGERIGNDFEISAEGNFTLITGANMAGKSTFLRTVATNMILAMAGAPVCAADFSFRPIKLFSSMRTSDSLSKHESYFYAELRRLKELLEYLRTGDKLFIILDEILKGTNSTDKQKGSRAALKQIIELGGTGIIATHDLELASIENEFPERVRNQCFEIEIDEARISFDYKLKEGITTKMNAMLLMRQMGIIND